MHTSPPPMSGPTAVAWDAIPLSGGCPQTFKLQRSEGSYMGRFVSIGTDAYAGFKPHAGAILHPEELRYFLPLPAERRRVSFLLGRYAAKRALCPSLGQPALNSVNIAPGIFKSPVVCYPMEHPWQVSISHSDTLVVAIAFPMVHPMAVDVELIDPGKVSVMLAHCRDSEPAELSRLGLDQPAAAAVLWSAKEALSKVLGTGLMCPFEVFELHSITRPASDEFEGLYRNLVQYKFHSWVHGSNVLTIVLPKRTDIFFEGGRPGFPLSALNRGYPSNAS